MYQYNMPELPQVEFERMRGMVEEAYRASLRGKGRPEPMVINQATMDLSEISQRYTGTKSQAESIYFGFAWNGTGRMWVRPGRPKRHMARTTIHELSHLRVDGQAHGSKFRRVFGVALAMYMHSTGCDWSEIRREIADLVYRYRRYRMFTPKGKYNVYSDYTSRCLDEINSIDKAAKKACNIWL